MPDHARAEIRQVHADMVAHWEEEMGPDFTVMGKTLTQAKAELPAEEVVNTQRTEQEATVKATTGTQNTMLDGMEKGVGDYKKAVEIVEGKKSRKWITAPKFRTPPRKKTDTGTQTGGGS